MEQNNITYNDIISDRNYIKLMLSGMIDRFGDSVDAIAFTWLVYQITHNAMWSAIVFALNTLPNVIVQPFAGAIVEKKNKKKVIILTYILRAVVISTFAALYTLDLVTAPVMAVLTLIITTIESFSLPASSAFTAQVVRKEHLTIGLSISKMLTSAAALVGTGIAGVIIATWGAVPAMLIDISTFIIAAVLMNYPHRLHIGKGFCYAAERHEPARCSMHPAEQGMSTMPLSHWLTFGNTFLNIFAAPFMSAFVIVPS